MLHPFAVSIVRIKVLLQQIACEQKREEDSFKRAFRRFLFFQNDICSLLLEASGTTNARIWALNASRILEH